MDYQQEVQAMAENLVGDLLDAWQCQEWGTNVRTFMQAFADEVQKITSQLATELEADE